MEELYQHICVHKLFANQSPEELRFADIHHLDGGSVPHPDVFPTPVRNGQPLQNSDKAIRGMCKRTHISSNIVVKMLIERGLPKYLPIRYNILHIEYLLTITDISGLNAMDKSRHFEMVAAVKIFRNASYRLSRHYLKKAIGNDTLSVAHRKLVNLPMALYRLGLFEEAITLLISDLNGPNLTMDSTYPNMMIFRLFYEEKWNELLHECNHFLTQRPLRNVAGFENEVHGIRVYCCIRLGMVQRAKQLLNEAVSDPIFQNNPIITYCACNLDEHCTMDIRDYNLKGWNSGIIYLFQGMIYQLEMQQYAEAILMYHHCTFYEVRVVNYFRLFQCYGQLGLIGKAYGYLLRAKAVKMNNNEMNTYLWRKNFEELEDALKRMLGKRRCDVCGKSGDRKCRLHACCGCLNVYYCSKQCQKVGWKEGHDERCSKRFCGFKRRLRRAKKSPFMTDDDAASIL